MENTGLHNVQVRSKQDIDNLQIELDATKELDNLWTEASRILHGNSEHGGNKAEEISNIMHKVTGLLIRTSLERRDEEISCTFCQRNNPYNKVYSWTGQHREYLKQMACEQLRYFEQIVSEAGFSFLTCKGVLIPLMLLLLSLKPTDKRKIPPDIELLYVNILYHISRRISSNEQFLKLLAMDLYTEEGFKIPRFTFFELLILYTHKAGTVGSLARDGILCCIKATCADAGINQYLSQESAGCVIIAGGLSARYSSLPTTFEISSEDWHCITISDINNMRELQAFLNALSFCCKVAEAGSRAIKNRLSLLIHDGFLKSVLAPALNQSSTDAQIAVMAYLDLFLRSITNERVMEVFLRVLLTEAYDNKPLINLLIYHINSEAIQLSMVAMQLFKTLLELNCEDIIFHLIFRYLLPCHHILPNQKRTIKEMDFYCKSATMFLYLTPPCCIETNRNPLSVEPEESSPLLSRSSLSAGSPHSEVDRKTSSASVSSSTSKSSNSSTLSELRPQEMLDFMAYLYDARAIITTCKKACRCWSAVYDGMDVGTDNPRLKNARYKSYLSPVGTSSLSPTSYRTPGSFIERTLSNTSTDSDVSSSGLEVSLHETYTTDCLGPFLNALFDRIECMIENNIYVNLLLTSLVTRLACYPQPLLRSFLLNANLVIQPGVRSLSQILSYISTSADQFVSQLDDYKLLIVKARQNLIRRESRGFKRLSQEFSAPLLPRDGKEKDSACSINLDHRSGASKFQKKEVQGTEEKSIGVDELVSLTPGKHNASFTCINTSQVKDGAKRAATFSGHPGHIGKLHPAMPWFGGRSPSRRHRKIPSKKDLADMRKKHPVVIKNAIYCVVLLEEFMKELAAVSIEQTLL